MNHKQQTSPRLDPLPPEHTPELQDQFHAFHKTLGFIPNSVLTMQRKPKLVRAFVAMQGAIWDPESKVDRGFKRLLAHVASSSANDPYSMAHTASGALHFGIDREKLAAVRTFQSSARFSEAEKVALAFAAAASATPSAVTDEAFAALRRHWDEEEIVEILAAIAMASFLARWNITMITPIEEEPLAIGEKHLAPHGWSAGRHRR